MMSRSDMNRCLFLGIGIICAVLLIVLWYQPFNYHVFIGDDLSFLEAYNAGFTSQGFLRSILTMGSSFGKFRPISSALILLSADLCRNHYDCYVHLNYAILLLNASLIAMGAYIASAKWWPSVIMATLALTVSRFAYYAVYEVMGLMENISMTFVLLWAFCALKFQRDGKLIWMALQILFYCLALFSHERFIVLIIPLLLSLLLERKRMRQRVLYSYATAIVLATIAYLVVKQVGLHDSVFTGTMNTSILSTFTLPQFLSFMWQGFLNLIGFNMGPAAWSGMPFTDAGPGGILVGLFLTGALIALVLALALRRPLWTGTQIPLKAVAFLAVTIGVLLVSASITFRQEFRWLYAPFAAFLLLVCFGLSAVQSSRTRLIFTVILSLAFTAVDTFYRPYINANFGFLRVARMASSVKAEVIDKLGPSRLSKNAVYIVTNRDHYIQHWTLADQYFFRLYSPEIPVDVRYVNSLQVLPTNISLGKPYVVFQIVESAAVRVAPETVQRLVLRKQRRPRERIVYDFLANLPSSVAMQSSPPEPSMGYPPFISYWHDDTGTKAKAIMLTSSSSIQYSSVPCDAKSRLQFRAGMPYQDGDGADLSVDVQVPGSNGVGQRLAEISFQPASIDETVTWFDYDIPLALCKGGMIDITFTVDSPSLNTLNDVIAVADAMVVSPQ